MWNLKNKYTNKKQNETYKFREQLTITRGKRGRGMSSMGEGEWGDAGFQLQNEWANRVEHIE